MNPLLHRALMSCAARIPAALVLPPAVCGPARSGVPGRADSPSQALGTAGVSALIAGCPELVVPRAANPPMLKAAVEGSHARLARHTPKARVCREPARIIALTIDDGPGVYTSWILAIVKAKGVRATFFVIGGHVHGHHATVRALAAADMSVRNHTGDHVNLARAGAATARSEISRTDSAIKAVTGVRPTCVSPRVGSHDCVVMSIAARGGHRVVSWSIDPEDGRGPGSAIIRSSVLRHAANNRIVIMHDGGGNRGQTVAALPGVINGLRARGYSFVTLCQR